MLLFRLGSTLVDARATYPNLSFRLLSYDGTSFSARVPHTVLESNCPVGTATVEYMSEVGGNLDPPQIDRIQDILDLEHC